MISPFANSVRQQPIDLSQFGLGALFQRLGAAQPTNNVPQTQMMAQPAQPANPFEGNEQYQALMEFQQSLAPNQEQQTQLQDLRSAFEGTGAYKDYRINQLQNQLQQPMPVPRGGYNQYQNQFGAMGYNQPQQQQYMNPYQQMRPMPQQFSGYGMGQQMGGYGSYGQMPNPYQPRQFGNNPNNSMNYAQPQQQGYGGNMAQQQAVY